MEKLHKLAEPERFTHIRLQKSPALEFLLFEGLFQDREIMSYVIRLASQFFVLPYLTLQYVHNNAMMCEKLYILFHLGDLRLGLTSYL